MQEADVLANIYLNVTKRYDYNIAQPDNVEDYFPNDECTFYGQPSGDCSQLVQLCRFISNKCLFSVQN